MRTETIRTGKLEQSLARASRRAPVWVLPTVKFLLMFFDSLAAVAAFAAAFKIRQGSSVISDTAWAWSQEFLPYGGILISVIPIRLAMSFYQRLYKIEGAFSYINQFARIVKSVTVGSLLITAFAFLFRGGYQFSDFSYSRGIFIFDYFLALVFFSIIHIGFRYLQTKARESGLNLIPTLIVGGREARQTIKELAERPDLGYRVVGLIDTDEESSTHDRNGIPVIGTLEDLPELIRQIHIQEVIITDTSVQPEFLFETMMKVGRHRRVEFRIAPTLIDVLPQKTDIEQIGILPMVKLFSEPLSNAEKILKRAFDLSIALIAAIVSVVPALIIAVFIKIDSRGSIFFKQERIGMDGRPFLCYKFRTMIADADENLHREMYSKNIGDLKEANSGSGEKPLFGKVKNDPRITRTGKILRRLSLDELPQIINVLKGEMSIVGPRPPIPYEVELYGLRHRKRLDVKPGITGLWQVSGRSRLSFREMVKIDLYYIENRSLWLDLKIILLTIPAVLKGDGAK